MSRRMLVVPVLAALAATALIGCSDEGNPLTGTWLPQGVTSKSSVTIYKDSRVSVIGTGYSCSGTAVEQGDKLWRFDLDCGTKKGTATAKITGPDTMDLTVGTVTTPHRRQG
ncbi:hypothetical protein ACSNOI_39940 [Actinomadura kijaniata]|uniref:hypothetical protein n=1 Tax=Actinomadura kijaniata TaxID=46161 RepID=UPI003F1D5C5A